MGFYRTHPPMTHLPPMRGEGWQADANAKGTAPLRGEGGPKGRWGEESRWPT